MILQTAHRPPHSFLHDFVINLSAAPVIVFCRSGRRAGKAKETLEQLGYTRVLNAGGLDDLLVKLK